MNATEHPRWCDLDRCRAEVDAGPHESRPVKVTGGRGAGKAPRIMLLLWSPAGGRPVKIRLVVIGDLLINSLDIDLDGAAQLATRINELIGRAT